MTCGAPLRNRTVDLLLTIYSYTIPSLQVGGVGYVDGAVQVRSGLMPPDGERPVVGAAVVSRPPARQRAGSLRGAGGGLGRRRGRVGGGGSAARVAAARV